MRSRKLRYVVVAVGLALVAGPSAAVEGVDLGSKTSGVGTSDAAQPSPQPSIRVGPSGIPDGAVEPDTPGKTGLGNTGRDPVGGAGRGPGSKPNLPEQ